MGSGKAGGWKVGKRRGREVVIRTGLGVARGNGWGAAVEAAGWEAAGGSGRDMVSEAVSGRNRG